MLGYQYCIYSSNQLTGLILLYSVSAMLLFCQHNNYDTFANEYLFTTCIASVFQILRQCLLVRTRVRTYVIYLFNTLCLLKEIVSFKVEGCRKQNNHDYKVFNHLSLSPHAETEIVNYISKSASRLIFTSKAQLYIQNYVFYHILFYFLFRGRRGDELDLHIFVMGIFIVCGKDR